MKPLARWLEGTASNARVNGEIVVNNPGLGSETSIPPKISQSAKLYPGDWVEVKTPGDILPTLDADGALDRLPFMPEMVQFCGRRFQVSQRVFKTCYYTIRGSSGMRKFRADDVVILEGVRCSGAEHDGCEKACLIFWREAWLRKVEDGTVHSRVEGNGGEQLRSRLKTSTGPKTYFCQASEILKATDPLSRWERFRRCSDEVRAGNYSTLQLVQRVGIWLIWKFRRRFWGTFARGDNESTPAAPLNLRPGEQIEVKSLASITKTLDEGGHHRGLYFMPAMRLLCGQECRVERKVEKIIVDGTGEMRQLRNTVYLEGALCGCAHVTFGGCPRGEFAYWREIWLRRSAGPDGQTRTQKDAPEPE